MSARSVSFVGLLLATLAGLALPGASAAARPALSISASPAVVPAGGSVVVSYTTARRPARLVLRLGDRQVANLKARARGRVRIAVPADVSPGRRQLSGCVRHRCRRTAITVTAPASGPGGSPEPNPEPDAPTPPGPPAVDFTGPANPLEVTAHADDSRSAAKTIGLAGGMLSTKGADGTRYELEVPEGALLSDERIVMKPITRVDGLPFSGGFEAAVQLEPSGLRFVQPVNVTISGHAPVPAAQETAFLYQEAGKEFQLYPLHADPTTTSFRLLHFSGVGVGRATDADRNAQLLRATRDHDGRLTQALSEIMRHDRVFQLTGQGEPLDPRDLETTLRAYHDQSLAPLMAAALTDDNLAIQAINRFLGWDRLVSLMIGDDFMIAERKALHDKMLAIMEHAAVRAHRRCVDENRPEELPMVLSWWRQLSLLGIMDQAPAELFEAIRGCARFELDLTTKLRQERGWGGPEGPEIWSGEAIVENLILEPDPQTLQQHGTTDAQYLDFEIKVPPHPPGTGCWYGSTEWDASFPFTVSQVEIDLNPIQKPDGSYGYPELERGAIRVTILPFMPHEQVFASDCNGTSPPVADTWLGLTWHELHEDEEGEFGGYEITDWTTPVGGGSMMGAKTYFRTRSFSGFPTTEETTIELYHRPVG